MIKPICKKGLFSVLCCVMSGGTADSQRNLLLHVAPNLMIHDRFGVGQLYRILNGCLDDKVSHNYFLLTTSRMLCLWSYGGDVLISWSNVVENCMWIFAYENGSFLDRYLLVLNVKYSIIQLYVYEYSYC